MPVELCLFRSRKPVAFYPFLLAVGFCLDVADAPCLQTGEKNMTLYHSETSLTNSANVKAVAEPHFGNWTSSFIGSNEPRLIHLFDRSAQGASSIATTLRKIGYDVEIGDSLVSLARVAEDSNTAAVVIDATLMTESAFRQLSRAKTQRCKTPVFVTSGDQTALDRINTLAQHQRFPLVETMRTPFSGHQIAQRIASQRGDPSQMLQRLDVLSAVWQGAITPAFHARIDLTSGDVASADLANQMTTEEFGEIDQTTMFRHLDPEARRTLLICNIAFVQKHFVFGAYKQLTCPISMRISALDLCALATDICLVANQTPGLTERLIFAMTEADLGTLPDEKLQQLIRAGIRFSCRDVRDLPMSISARGPSPVDLTVATSIVNGIATSQPQQAAFRSIAKRARNFGVRVIADGVASADDLRFLQEIGCDAASGSAVAHPMTIQALAAFKGTSAHDAASLHYN